MINVDRDSISTVKRLVFAARTDIGKIRPVNEDSTLLESWPDGGALLAVVSDGMGGHVKGEVASGIVIDTLADTLNGKLPEKQVEMYDFLLSAFYRADETIREKASSSPKYIGMGATVVAAIITPEQCIHLHAGDCRFYHFRNGDHAYVTKDHSIIQILLDSGKISPEEINEHPMRSVVTSSLGSGTSGFKAEPSWVSPSSECPAFIQLAAGDTILLTSDGLHGGLDADFLNDLVVRYGSNPEELVEKAVAAALDAGGEDNISIIAVHVFEDEIGDRSDGRNNPETEITNERNVAFEESLNQTLEKPDFHPEKGENVI